MIMEMLIEIATASAIIAGCFLLYLTIGVRATDCLQNFIERRLL